MQEQVAVQQQQLQGQAARLTEQDQHAAQQQRRLEQLEDRLVQQQRAHASSMAELHRKSKLAAPGAAAGLVLCMPWYA